MMNQHASTPLSRSRRARLKKNQEPIQTDEPHLESQQPQANESTVIQKRRSDRAICWILG